ITPRVVPVDDPGDPAVTRQHGRRMQIPVNRPDGERRRVRDPLAKLLVCPDERGRLLDRVPVPPVVVLPIAVAEAGNARPRGLHGPRLSPAVEASDQRRPRSAEEPSGSGTKPGTNMSTTDRVIAEDANRALDHGFVRLDGAMATDLSVVNAARVSFARRKDEMDAADEGLIRFLMRDRHGTPFEHNSFRFHIRAPIFVAREWFRHRVGCLTGDTVVTFVDINSNANRALSKTIDELWRMWTVGEKNGHALAPEVAAEDELRADSGKQ